MAWFKRIGLFLAVNVLVMLTISTLLLLATLGIILGIFLPMLSAVYSSAMQPL